MLIFSVLRKTDTLSGLPSKEYIYELDAIYRLRPQLVRVSLSSPRTKLLHCMTSLGCYEDVLCLILLKDDLQTLNYQVRESKKANIIRIESVVVEPLENLEVLHG